MSSDGLESVIIMGINVIIIELVMNEVDEAQTLGIKIPQNASATGSSNWNATTQDVTQEKIYSVRVDELQ